MLHGGKQSGRHTFQGYADPGSVDDDAMRATASDGQYNYTDRQSGNNREGNTSMRRKSRVRFSEGEGMSTVPNGMAGGGMSVAHRQSGSTMEIPRSAGSGNTTEDFEVHFEDSHMLGDEAAAAVTRYTQAPRKSRLAFVFGSGGGQGGLSGIAVETKQSSLSSACSNPAPSPYEAGIEFQASSEEDRASFTGLNNMASPGNFTNGVSNQTFAESGLVDGHRALVDMQQQDEKLEYEAGQRTSEEEDSASDDNSSVENGGDYTNNQLSDGLSAVAQGRKLFGSSNILGNKEWQRGSGKQGLSRKELNPEFEYLRKRREPNVKVLANRLSHRALSNSPISDERIVT